MSSADSKPIIGVLALQGCVEPHQKHIEAAGAIYKPVKTKADFDAADAFILPGGESTTMLKLIDVFGLWDSLAKNFAAKPVWGICAGAILMAETVTSPQQKSFGLLPITVQRNAYGRQAESHFAPVNGYEVCYIRAPVITACAPGVEVLAAYEETPVWVQQGRYMASTFHAELSHQTPSPMHAHFVQKVMQHKKAAA